METTAPDGNLVRGWKGLLTSLELDITPDMKYKQFKEGERVFSKSSVSSFAAVNGVDLLTEKLKSVQLER